jgi:hypothetical protein
MTSNSGLTEASPSVQAHLQIIQAVIVRMANNSSACKAWCITLVSAILVVVAEKDSNTLVFIALVPTVFFLALDAYYLALEHGFRESYNNFINKMHRQELHTEDLFVVTAAGKTWRHELKAIKSFSVWGFYGPLMLVVEIVRRLVLAPT